MPVLCDYVLSLYAKAEKGEAGPSGSEGDKGQSGFNGSKGERGVTGLKGDPGDDDSVAGKGAKGDKGDKGDGVPKGCVSKVWTPYWCTDLSFCEANKACPSNEVATIPEDVTMIPKGVLSECTPNPQFADINIPKCVEEIGDYAFYNNYGIKSVTFESASKPPPSADTLAIGDFAFGLNKQNPGPIPPQGVTQLVIPGNCSKIGRAAFLNHTNLTCLMFQTPSSHKGGPEPPGEPETPSSLGIVDDAFRGCSGLKGTLVLPYGILYVGYGAFFGTNITDIWVPKSCDIELNGQCDGEEPCPAIPFGCLVHKY